MVSDPTTALTKRERQIMQAIYPRGQVTAAELEALLPGTPANSTVRTQLRVLEQKGHLIHDEIDGRFVYRPTHPRKSVARAALDQIVSTFFDGSVEQVLATLLSSKAANLTSDELDRLAALIDRAKTEGEAGP